MLETTMASTTVERLLNDDDNNIFRRQRKKSSSTITSIDNDTVDEKKPITNGLNEENKEDFLPDVDDLLMMPRNCAEQVEEFAKYVWETGWRAMPHSKLPNWLKDNEFLQRGHRPPLPSIRACFHSIFRIHTETGNIWTHFIGAFAFLIIATFYFTSYEIEFQEKFIFGVFFIGAITCLMFSALFHTFYCHSPEVCRLWNKLDYCGISVLIMGSMVPWLYYAFYCDYMSKIAYFILILVLGASCIVASLSDSFSASEFRAYRAAIFTALGSSSLIPAIHYIFVNGWYKVFSVGAFFWFILTGALYASGAYLYASRIPERWFPGKFDIWFQSHQIFHVFVVAAAFVHYHGISILASYRLNFSDCLAQHTATDLEFSF